MISVKGVQRKWGKERQGKKDIMKRMSRGRLVGIEERNRDGWSSGAKC